MSLSTSSSGKAKAAKAARNTLTLKQKYKVIDTAKKNPGMSVRAIANKFLCGRSQIATILNNKETVVEQYESNMSSTSMLTRKRSDFAPVNEALYTWYSLATSRNIYPAGPQLCEKAKQIAEQLNIPDFNPLPTNEGCICHITHACERPMTRISVTQNAVTIPTAATLRLVPTRLSVDILRSGVLPLPLYQAFIMSCLCKFWSYNTTELLVPRNHVSSSCNVYVRARGSCNL